MNLSMKIEDTKLTIQNTYLNHNQYNSQVKNLINR